MNEVLSGKEKAAKVIAIIAFCLVMTALAIAITSDIVIFIEQIVMFIAACLLSVITFILGFILMVISIVLIFGFFLLQTYGFWPYNWAVSAFKEIMADAAPTAEQFAIMSAIRIVLIVLCAICLVLAILTLALNAKKDEEGIELVQAGKLAKGFGISTLILSILGIFMGVVTMLILSSLMQ